MRVTFLTAQLDFILLSFLTDIFVYEELDDLEPNPRQARHL